MSRLDAFHWRDYAGMNQWVAHASFPSLQFEFKDDWNDRSHMGKVWVFDRVVLADRSAAMRAWNFARFQRTAAAPFALPGSANWWSPIRNKVVELAGMDPEANSGTLSGHIPLADEEASQDESESSLKSPPFNKPVITYISRQNWGRRMLIPADHKVLVEELYRLRDTYGYEVNVVDAEKMNRQQQVRLAARTTVSNLPYLHCPCFCLSLVRS